MPGSKEAGGDCRETCDSCEGLKCNEAVAAESVGTKLGQQDGWGKDEGFDWCRISVWKL